MTKTEDVLFSIFMGGVVMIIAPGNQPFLTFAVVQGIFLLGPGGFLRAQIQPILIYASLFDRLVHVLHWHKERTRTADVHDDLCACNGCLTQKILDCRECRRYAFISCLACITRAQILRSRGVLDTIMDPKTGKKVTPDER